MKSSWSEAVDFTFAAEGFFSHDKWGGDTILGISKHYWPEDYKAVMSLVEKGDTEGAVSYVEGFYRKHFWDFVHADDLPYPLDIIAFDCSVNPGQNWCKSQLSIMRPDEPVLYRCGLLLEARTKYYIARVHSNPEKEMYLKGWLNRVEALRTKYLGEG